MPSIANFRTMFCIICVLSNSSQCVLAIQPMIQGRRLIHTYKPNGLVEPSSLSKLTYRMVSFNTPKTNSTNTMPHTWLRYPDLSMFALSLSQ